MKKNTIILIGAIDYGHLATNGETIKNQLLLQRFKDLYDSVIIADTNHWQKRPWCLLKVFWLLLWNKNVPIVVSASDSSSKLFNFLYFFPIKNNVNYWVIGGALPTKIREGLFKLRSLAKLNRIIVEGVRMAEELKVMGLNNVIRVPNFKPIDFFPNIQNKEQEKIFHFVFLSRVHPSKGIHEIVEACNELNSIGLKDLYHIDFYGPIEPEFESDFNKMISNCETLSYKGFLNLTNNEGYAKLAQYDTMLFPTYWTNEGFPGVVIDAYIAGLPIIASDWNMNKEVIINEKTGFLIPVHNSHALALKMNDIITRKIDLFKMRCICSEHAKLYDYRNVITMDLLKEITSLK